MISPPKTLTNMFFNDWLTLMGDAYIELTIEEFEKLEDKILAEIKARRKNRANKG
jgi:hypothetical protein